MSAACRDARDRFAGSAHHAKGVPWATNVVSGGMTVSTTHAEFNAQANADFRHYLKKAYRRMHLPSSMSECTTRTGDSDPSIPKYVHRRPLRIIRPQRDADVRVVSVVSDSGGPEKKAADVAVDVDVANHVAGGAAQLSSPLHTATVVQHPCETSVVLHYKARPEQKQAKMVAFPHVAHDRGKVQ